MPFLQHLTYDFQIGSAMRFFKNASKMQYAKVEKSHVRFWEGAPKNVRPFTQEKSGREESKKDKLVDFRRTWNQMS